MTEYQYAKMVQGVDLTPGERTTLRQHVGLAPMVGKKTDPNWRRLLMKACSKLPSHYKS